MQVDLKYKEHYDQEIENEQRFIRKPTNDIANQLTEQWGYKVIDISKSAMLTELLFRNLRMTRSKPSKTI